MLPDYWNKEWHEEYGGLYGFVIEKEMLEINEALLRYFQWKLFFGGCTCEAGMLYCKTRKNKYWKKIE